MTLHAYLKKVGLTDEQFAAKILCSRGYITQLRLGIRKQPSLPVAFKIERATGGKVPVKVWGIAEASA